MPNWVSISAEVYPKEKTKESLDEFKKFKEEMFGPCDETPNGRSFDFNRIIPMPKELDIVEISSLNGIVFIWYLEELIPDKKIEDLTQEELETYFNQYFKFSLKEGQTDENILRNLTWMRFSINLEFMAGLNKDKIDYVKSLKRIISRIYLNEVGFLSERDYMHLTVAQLKLYLILLSQDNPWVQHEYNIAGAGFFLTEADITTQYWKNLKTTGHFAWYSWRCENWGTKWNACHYDEGISDDNLMCFNFDTAWSLPMPVMEAVMEKYPNLIFEYSFHEESGAFGGSAYSEEGKMVYHFTD